MSIADLQNKNLLELAKSSTESSILSELANATDSIIRRAVARNINTPSKILAFLIEDPVLNVSYMASLNPNCISSRDFSDASHPCVICESDERLRICEKCKNLLSYKAS